MNFTIGSEAIVDKATYVEPHQYSEGIDYVLVNGELVVDLGKHHRRPSRHGGPHPRLSSAY